MKIALSGGSGFIGTYLKRTLRAQDYTLTMIPRAGFQKSDDDFCAEYIDGHDVVINLAGAPLVKKWTSAYKTEITSSRILTTRKISTAIDLAKQPPTTWINASAVGIYNDTLKHTEESTAYSGSFLGKLCRDWEGEAWKSHEKCRVILLRFGMVLGKEEGALEKMTTPFKKGIGARIGNGNQGVSFIHIDDLMQVFLFVMGHSEIEGPVNAVAEYPTDNYYFSEMLGKVFGQPVYFSIPKIFVRMLFGEGSVVLTEGQKVIPKKLLDHGFRFEYPSIDKALVGIFRE